MRAHRLLSIAGISVAATYALSACAGGAGSGTPDVPAGNAAARSAAVALAGARPAAHGVRRASQPTCTGSGANSFVGINNLNVAAASFSVVTGGDANDACAQYGMVGGGANNGIDGSSTAALIGGGQFNAIASSTVGTIAGGTANAVDNALGGTIAGGSSNSVAASYDAIAGGENNTASGQASFIGGGQQNADNLAAWSTISGGESNAVSATFGTIAGGDANSISNNEYGFIGGGDANKVSGEYGAIPGGLSNAVSSASGAIAGGQSNRAVGSWGAVGGGYGNQAGELAAVPGGKNNVANGLGSLAAGVGSTAGFSGDFVWSDFASGATALKGTAANQFLARASGGVTFYSSPKLTSGVQLAAGSGTWSSLSDRNAKSNILPVSDDDILSRVATLPVSEWSYTTERGVRHVGPMAQDFYAAFNVGEDDRHITSIDEDGVALAAIKALDAKLARKDAAIQALQRRDSALQAELTALAARVNALGSNRR